MARSYAVNDYWSVLQLVLLIVLRRRIVQRIAVMIANTVHIVDIIQPIAVYCKYYGYQK